MAGTSSSKGKKFFCSDCEAGYVRRADFENHFNLQKVRASNVSTGSGGALIDNPCFKRVERRYGSTLSEARSLKGVRRLSFGSSSSSMVQAPVEKNYFREASDHISQDLQSNISPAPTLSDTSAHQSGQSEQKQNQDEVMQLLVTIDKKIDKIFNKQCSIDSSSSKKPEAYKSDYRAVLKKVLGLDNLGRFCLLILFKMPTAEMSNYKFSNSKC